ncbi:uncharacterized protein LOC128236749 isoform X2 [Mya arenaria]|uniref:uncharacterized protein LOC128236749 isoform X2 n=1 Tax=Mya arenaria TaxID=6604 RepID=UPI0022DEB466|nr:uncharacterized protein LOC128236749 isoform X2 [Mya arenaria]
MTLASQLPWLPWILAVFLRVSLGSVVFSGTPCYTDICSTEKFCDDGVRHCRLCDDIRDDCMKTSLPADCMSWCIGYLTNKGVESIIQRNKVADCPDLGPLDHGNYLNVSNYRHGTNVKFTCDEGYRLVGMNTSTCGDFKTWSTPVPVCEEVKVFVSAGWRNATVVQAPFIVILLFILILMVFYIVRLRMRHTPKDEERAVNGAAFNAVKSAVISVDEHNETEIRSNSLKSNRSGDSGIESSRESRTVSEERGGDIGRVLDTERDTLSGRDTHGPLRIGAASELNIEQNGGIGSAPSTQRAESEPSMESNAPTKSCDTGESSTGELPTGERPTGKRPTGERPTGERRTGERPTGECPTGGRPTGERLNGDKGQFMYIDYSTNVKNVEIHVKSNTRHNHETYNYKSGDNNSSSLAYKSNNDSNNVKSNNTDTDNDNVGPRNSEIAAAPTDASSCTGRNSPQTGNVDLDRAAKKQFQEDIKFGTPETNLTTDGIQPEEQGGPFEVITNVEDSYHGVCSPTQLNVRLSDASAVPGDNATDPDNSEREPLLTS